MTGAGVPCGGRVAVVGAGIAGLAAAFELRDAGVEAIVLEASDRHGGKIDASHVGGMAVDSGPDGFVARDPAAAQLCHRLGLGAELVSPAASGAFVWSAGRLRPLPGRCLLGVPWTADAVAGTGIVSGGGVAALRHGLAAAAAPLRGDASVGEVLRPRLGDEVFEQLVDPLLGGINAGSADRMSIEACAAPLCEAARRGGPLGPALRDVAAQQDHSRVGGVVRGHQGDAAAPVFHSVRGGVTRLVDALASELGDAVNLTAAVESVSHTRRAAPATSAPGSRVPRWTVRTSQGSFDAGGVILACPAWESARLLERPAPDAAEILAGIEYADVALATFAVPNEHLARALDGTGFLVPRSQRLLATACSWSSSKWRHYARETVAVLRVSTGRTDDRRWLDLRPGELVPALARELAETGVVSARAASRGLFEARETRWLRSLPQYRPGHLERVAAMEACLAGEAPGLVVAGAALRGLGLPACIRGAQTAAATVARAVLC